MKLFALIMAGTFGLLLLVAGLVPALIAIGAATACSVIAWDRGASGGKYKELGR